MVTVNATHNLAISLTQKGEMIDTKVISANRVLDTYVVRAPAYETGTFWRFQLTFDRVSDIYVNQGPVVMTLVEPALVIQTIYKEV